MAYSRNGGSRNEAREEKNPPVFSRKMWTPSGTIELAIFEKQVQGSKKDHTNFFVTIKRSYYVPGEKGGDGKFEDTTVMNPQDLLIVADLYKIAWDFILDECNRQ